jgi:raffinose/stachyose/melibiose transport system substrate-binding protein
MDLRSRRRPILVALAIGALSMATVPGVLAQSASESPAAPTPAATAAPVYLSLLVDDTQNTVDTAQSVIAAFEAKYAAQNIHVEIETRPGGTDGDNIVKTRLATNTMDDIFWYNSGSLLQALHPADTLVDLSGQPFVSNIADSFLSTVSAGSEVFGVPWGTALGGGVLYNKKDFAAAGVSVPKTWAEFEANNDKLKAAGFAPVGQTYGADSTWTSQLFVLADYCNVQNAIPDFATKYTNNQEKYATTPEALRGFQYLEEGFQKGWYQQDFGSATFDDGLNMLASGQIAQYPMLSFALSTIAQNHPDNINDIGYFGLPGTDASKNCSTIWMPGGSYVPKTTQHPNEAMLFQAFLASKEGSDAITAAVPPQGPYVTKDAVLPSTVLPAVDDIQAYIASGNTAPALEFLSPVKGPNLENITVAVGSGITSAADGAAQYDADVVAEAQQLGLPGW